MRTYYLRSFGCQMNAHDAERIRALLEAEGLERADEPDGADVLVYNTCTVRQSADERLAGHLGTAARLKREDAGRIVLVTGCLPQAEQDDFFRRFPFVDGALGPQNLHRLPELLAAAVAPARPAGRPPGFFADGAAMSGDLAARRERPYQAWVQIMSGCTNFCSYCIVPQVRGPERSRDLGTLVAEVRALVADGVREVTLLGQNVNAYGLDLRRGRARGSAGLPGAAARPRRRAGARPRALHDLAPQGSLGRPHPGARRAAQRVRARASAGAGRLRPRAGRDGPRLHRGRLSRARACLARGRAGRERHHGPHRRVSPARATTTSRRRSSWCARREFDAAFTFVFSPRRGTAAAELPGQIAADGQARARRASHRPHSGAGP